LFVSRRYLSLVGILFVVSTGLVASIWVLRKGDPIDLLVLQGPDSLFAGAGAPRTISVGVVVERNVELLEFRFRCLLQREAPPGIVGSRVNDSLWSTLRKLPAVRQRAAYFSEISAQDYVTVRRVPLTNGKGEDVILADFGEIYSVLFDPYRINESLTTFALVVNATGNVVEYYEGYSDFFPAKTYLLESLRVETDGESIEYGSQSFDGALSVQKDLASFGVLSFPDPRKGTTQGVTIVVKKTRSGIPEVVRPLLETRNFLEIIETYVDAEYNEAASGYWRISNGWGEK